MPWQLEDHTADVALRVDAEGWPALLEQAVLAFSELVCGGPIARGGPGAPPRRVRKLRVAGETVEEAWVQWWRELLRLWTVEGLLAVEAGVHEDARPADTRAVVRCVPAAALDAAALTDVKAVTRHRAEAGPLGDAEARGAWRGRIVLDV